MMFLPTVAPYYYCAGCEVYGCGFACWHCESPSTPPAFRYIDRGGVDTLIEIIVATVGMMPGEATEKRFEILEREGEISFVDNDDEFIIDGDIIIDDTDYLGPEDYARCLAMALAQ